ncbi:TrkH family potassium uptake protein [Bacillus sp. EB106-08-02-XG196]|jgi:Trk-type K+ transport system membrane component|uniref:TrkH family potassium uptake protein n=1 Tax=Bacillus sp. EB106-08-02-XG196 TaxID=2737049 RepID=UPI00211AF37E|nr:TrkH family potassium uptake protein [Bacillus sp. EB106-08-02-XG196]
MRLDSHSKKKMRFTSVQLLVLFYFAAVILSTILLLFPITLKDGAELSLLDALFISASAVSVTGLSTVSLTEILSVPGTFIFAFILQFGGIGVMTLGTFIWLLMGKKIGLMERKLIMTDQNQTNLSGLVILMRQILLIMIAIELIGTLILGFYFLNYFPTWEEAFLQGFFASISATTNAGFDITGESLIPFANDYFIQSINILLMIFGSIGFPVLIEIKNYFITKRKRSFRFSLFTKLTTFTFFALIIVGALCIYIFESNHFFADKAWHQSLFYSLFQSVTTRNGGLATMDMNEFSTPTLLVLSSLMFIGASPSSVGGGIRTTTFAIMLLAIYSYAKGKNSIKVFKREIDPQDVTKAFVVITTAAMICGIAVALLTFLEPKMSLLQLFFEVCSAFGTTGLSMGITADLSIGGKIIIILLMFIGRIGIFSFLFLLRGETKEEHYRYPKERVIIG